VSFLRSRKESAEKAAWDFRDSVTCTPWHSSPLGGEDPRAGNAQTLLKEQPISCLSEITSTRTQRSVQRLAKVPETTGLGCGISIVPLKCPQVSVPCETRGKPESELGVTRWVPSNNIISEVVKAQRC
jgi:hypothetical protein